MQGQAPHVPNVEDGLKSLSAVHIPRASEVVVRQLRRLIRQGFFLPGENLPSERQLADELGVSRVTVREALSFLYGEGLVEQTPRGASGGPRVLALPAPPEEEIRRELQQKLGYFCDILDCRKALETYAASEAARERTSEDLAVLEASIKEMRALSSEATKSEEALEATDMVEERLDTKRVREAARFRREAGIFHRTINAVGGNAKLLAILEDLRVETSTKVTVEVLYGDLQDKARLEEAMSEHETILEAIRQQDASAAAEAMRQHIDSTKKALVERAEKRF